MHTRDHTIESHAAGSRSDRTTRNPREKERAHWSLGRRLLACALCATTLASTALGQGPRHAAASPAPAPPNPCQTPQAWTPEAWQPKRYSESDTDGNFVDDEIDSLAPWSQIDVLLCLNACPRRSDLARFSGHGSVGYVSPYLTLVWLQGTTVASAALLGQDPAVAFVELDRECEPSSDVSTRAIKMRSSVPYAGQNVEDVYPALDGSGVNIAIIDTGIDFGHESLPAWKFVGGWDMTTLPGFETDPDDRIGHGTHVAGIAAGTGGPNGPRGVAPGAGLIDIRVFDTGSTTTTAHVIAALDKCIEKRGAWGIRVVNMSLGSLVDSDGGDADSQAANRAVQAGLVVCAAVGNSNARMIASPAAADDVIAVSALDDHATVTRADDDRWNAVFSGSNFGPRLDDGDSDALDELKPTVSAPGADILAPAHDSATGYVEKSGTSMACPHVAGLAAVLIQDDPALTPSQARTKLVGSGAWDPEFGFGEIDALRSVEAPPLPGPVETYRLTALDGAAFDEFGNSVAIDGTTAIVGAWGDDVGVLDSGSAYLFDTTTGLQLFKLSATDAAENDRFGTCVAISGTRAIVGAPFDDDGGPSSGSAYVFNPMTGQQLFKLRALDAAPGDIFGLSVAIDGTTALVGAPMDDGASGSEAGSVYVFNAATGQQLRKLVPVNPDSRFGNSVAISGTTAVIGAWGPLHLYGSAFLFNAATGQQLDRLTGSDASNWYAFGRSVAISNTTAIAGAPGHEDYWPAPGAAYLFDTVSGQEVFKLMAADASDEDRFGTSVAISGGNLIVGAPEDDDGAGNPGSAYLFSTIGQQLSKLGPSTPAPGFGSSVAIRGATAIVGAPGDGPGSAYLYSIP